MSTHQARMSLLGNYDNEEEDRANKQKYLVENIIQPGYDKQRFVEFMSESKENGHSIEEWTLLELMDMVKEFQKLHPLGSTPHDSTLFEDDENKDNNDEDGQNNEPHSINQEEINEPDSNVKMEESSPKKVFHKFVQIKQSRSEFSHLKMKDIKVKVSDGLVKKGGLFSFSYVSYKINFEPLGYEVRRKEEDFQSLRKYLWKTYQNMYIPPLLNADK